MLLGELITLRQHRLPVKIVVFNNGALSFVELEMKAAGLYATRTVLSGGGEELVELAKTNLRELDIE